MPPRLLTTDEFNAYDQYVRSHPQGTLWQSAAWKRYQEALGREVRIYADFGPRTSGIGSTEHSSTIHKTPLIPHPQSPIPLSSALVVIDRTSFGLSTWEIPRGPLENEVGDGRWETEEGSDAAFLLSHIIEDAKIERCLSLYYSPIKPLTTRYSLTANRCNPRHIHPLATRILDLTHDEKALLQQMHEKGRYNIRVAEKHGVRIERYDRTTFGWEEAIDAYVALAQKTGDRDRFIPASKRQLRAFLEHLEGSFLLLAYRSDFGHQTSDHGSHVLNPNSKFLFPNPFPIAGLLGVTWNGIGIYYYGASDYQYRNLMAPYLLQWETMKYCKALGCHSYDLLGIAPPDSGSKHPWAGVSEFKGKFGGSTVEYPPEQEVRLRPLVKRVLEMKRKMWR